MKLGLITQIRNEIEILQPFLNHIDGLFDVVHVIDHQSVDGTTGVLKQAVSQRPLWHYYFLDIKTKAQTEVSNFLLHKAFEDDLDYLFFLDADEFIEVPSRQDLENRLIAWVDPMTAGALTWKNCILGNFHQKEFTARTPLYLPAAHSSFFKSVLSRRLYNTYNKQLTISEGNHLLYDPHGVEIPITPIGTLLHVPIRSLSQVESKVILTVIARRGYRERKAGTSFQYYEMLEKIADGKVSDDDLRGFTIGFERPNIPNTAVSEQQLLSRGYTLTTLQDLQVVFSDRLQLDLQPVDPGIARRVAGALNRLEENFAANAPLVLEDGVIRLDNEKQNKMVSSIPAAHDGGGIFQSQAAQLEEQSRRIHDLSVHNEHLSAELEQARQEILSYVQSSSWKLTRPFRKVFGKMIRH